MKRQVYLDMKSLKEARDLFLTRFSDVLTGSEVSAVENALGRLTAEPVYARFSVPMWHCSAMDGIAVNAAGTFGVNERNPKVLSEHSEYRWVNTGQPLPVGFDSVIMVEKVHETGDGRVEIREPAYPWQHVRKVGEDIVATEMLFPACHRLRAYDLAGLIGAGVYSLGVRKLPRVGIIPSGSELVGHRSGKEPPFEPGAVIESNSTLLAGLAAECGAEPVIHDIVPDNEQALKEAVRSMVDSDIDILVINAGSSAGAGDYTVHVLRELGEVFVHGVAMMPGKPTVLAEVLGKPVVGNPGYPVSSALSFQQFLRPLIFSFQGLEEPEPERITVEMSRDVPSRPGMEEFLRVNIGKVGTRYIATPMARAAGSISTLTRAEGILRIPASYEGVQQNQAVEAELLVDRTALDKTVVVIGSHDMAIDVLADEVRRRDGSVRISSANVGSLGGLIALKKGSCHMAGAHLLDTVTGEYNAGYIRRYLPDLPVSVFNLTMRDQGLIVAKGNPLGITKIEDITRADVTFMNRQAGSGTRILLDHILEREGLSSDSIKGYDLEEFTHMAVAVAVLSGAADCGMGIHAAAKALGLDFVPLISEQYDLVVARSFVTEPWMKALFDTLGSPGFRNRVTSMGGYDPSRSGELLYEIPGEIQ